MQHLLKSAAARREKLRKAAEGRSFRWTGVVAAILAGLLCCIGLYGAFVDQDVDAVIMLAFGITLLSSTIIQHQQRRIDALRKLMKLTDRAQP